jgi:hypothetical protein
MKSLEAAGQGNRNRPREKIRGSQFVKREEKIRPKLRINPFEGWKKKQERKTPR